jgi:hypothetical protein
MRNDIFRATAALLLIVTAPGCGDDEFGRRYKVHGTVTYHSQPVENGLITFDPVASQGMVQVRVATGTIRNGSYTLSTAGNDDGAFPGSYRVAIRVSAADYTQVAARAQGDAGHQLDVVRATHKAKSVIPQKYQSLNTSGLIREVKAETNRFDFELDD